MAGRDSSLWKWNGTQFKYIGPTKMVGRRTTVYLSPRLLAEFEMNRPGIARIALSAEVASATRSLVVNEAMPYAIQISPRGRTLEYVSSWRAQPASVVIAGMRRAACKLINIADYAAAVEWGRGGNQRVLGRVLDHLNSTTKVNPSRPRPAIPRGPGNRFAPSPGRSAAEIRRRAQRATGLI